MIESAEKAQAQGLPRPEKAPGKSPLASIFIVMTEAFEGKEDEFNDWYTNIHCHDVMRLRGSVAVQRWKLSPFQLRYNAAHVGPSQRWLCIYELGDTQQNIDDHVELCFTDALPITSAQRIDVAEDFYYVPIDPRKDAVETFAARDGDVLTIRMNARPGMESDFIKWYRDIYLPRTLKLIGFIAGDLYCAADIQLIDAQPSFEFSAVYHIADPQVAVESLDSHLAQSETILDCPFVDTASVRVACYSAITNRLTAEQARNLPPAQRALEDQFRSKMGDRRHMSEAPGGLKIKRS